MLGDSGEVLESSAVAASAGGEEKDVKLEDSGERATVGGGGNRWPRSETLALLRIRSEMELAFRDSNLKAPLWEQISRKMRELGFRRSAKKCKEKFENVYKYHKRTKEGRSGKREGKTYQFSDELEAFENIHHYPTEPKSRPVKPPTTTTTTTAASIVPWISSSNPSSGTNPTLFTKQQPTPPFVLNHSAHTVLGSGHKLTNPYNFARNVPSLNLFSSSTSSSTASEEEEEEEEEGKRPRKRRRYWKGLLKRLTNDLMEKQEEMQKRFLETLEKREKERIEREQAWRVQETARINREYEIIAHERSASAAKDTAIISFLQKVSGQQQQQQQLQKQNHTQQQTREDHSIAFLNDQKHETRIVEAASKTSNSDSSYMLSLSSSRWPRDEVEALIRLRTNVEANYQENGTKGSLWEEISTGMQSLGYSRSAKRCKEKWENINKYFKKVKESNKKRPVDSKTCPYFHQLEAIHKEKNTNPTLPLMAAPQQLLLLPQETIDEPDKHKMGDEEGDKEEDEEEGDNETGGFETVLNKTCSPVDINNNVFA